MKTIGVIKGKKTHETRVALVPEVAHELKKTGAHVVIEKGAGQKAGYIDEDYKKLGLSIGENQADIIKASDLLVAIDITELAPESLEKKLVIGLCDPYVNQAHIINIKEQGATLIALELIPRISRAQSMDVLSSQANIAGYVAVLKAATKLNKVMPLMMTAAGTVRPAQVLILGAGVAGLQAIATAKRLGAMVHAYDVRSAVKEQVESLGAKFVKLALREGGEGDGGYAKALSEEAQIEQRACLTDFAKTMDIIITTAQIPGRRAPRLLDDRIFKIIKDGSVIIDMAAKSGGNVAYSELEVWKKIENAWLYGALDLACLAPKDASFTFSKNIKALFELIKQQEHLDLEDEIVREAVICSNNQWINKTYAQKINQQ